MPAISDGVDEGPHVPQQREGRGIRACHLLLLAVLGCGAITAFGGPVAAQEGGGDAVAESLGGALTVGDEDQPVAGVSIIVTKAGGDVVGEDTTDDDGMWSVGLPGPGDYAVTLDPATLPEGVSLRNPDRPTLEPTVRPGRQQQINFGLVGEGGGARSGPSLGTRLAQASTDGVKFGLIIAITAIGLSLIFGTTGLINFAHGELVAFGAITAWFLNTSGPTLPLLLAGLIATALGGLLGGGLEVGLWRPLRRMKVGLFQLLVITIGLSIALRHVLLIAFGGQSRPYRNYTIQQEIDIGPIAITPRDLGVMAIATLVLVGVANLLQRTRIGKAMRAVSDNVDLAESSGINVRRVVLFVWVLGGSLAAMGGVLLGTVASVNWLMGFQLLLLMFAGVILGGLGTAYGAMVGSLVIGLTTEISSVWFSPELKSVWALGVLIVVLLVRPQGILGNKERVG